MSSGFASCLHDLILLFLYTSIHMPSSAKQYRKKLHGWLSYAFARYIQFSALHKLRDSPQTCNSEVFVVVSLTLFLPICLEQFARDNGFLLPDRTHPCSSLKTNSTGTSQVPEQEARCVVKIGWAWIDSASFRYAFYIFFFHSSTKVKKKCAVYIFIRYLWRSKLLL